MKPGRMKMQNIFIATNILFGILLFNCCTEQRQKTDMRTVARQNKDSVKSGNPVVYFEIPVTDINRATKFYHSVFGFAFLKDSIDHNEMALFPFEDGDSGISGALAKGSSYQPSKSGTLIYFSTTNMEKTLASVEQYGGKTLYPKTSIGNLGFVAEFEDSEGNRIALYLKQATN
jgi:uncharacterized protein